MKRQLILQAEQKLLAAKAQLSEAKQISHDLNATSLAQGGGAAVNKRGALKVETVAPSSKKAEVSSPKVGFFGKKKEEKKEKKEKEKEKEKEKKKEKEGKKK